MNSEKTILVTGFGPFDCHKINASWEAVKELYEMKNHLYERHNVKLIIDHVPVDYEHVRDRISLLWKEHNPQFVLHVGVSHLAKCLTIEQKAHGIGYVRPDINGKCPMEKFDESSSEVIDTAINIEELCQKINERMKNNNEVCCKACISNEAGRYLCEYIYYQSLRNDPKRTLFIHVPDLNVYTSKTVAKGLCEIIELLVTNY